ncbi:MAG: hypothetical protein AB2L14_11490 [Candidatus Xenobiia bacterium LiM19]
MSITQAAGTPCSGSSDLPFISAEAVTDFLARCPETAAVCYPVFEKEEIDPAIRPGVPSYVRLREGYFTGGSIFRLDVAKCLERMPHIGKSFNARKSAVANGQASGLFRDAQVSFWNTELSRIFRRDVKRFIRAPVALIRGCSAGITVDIDDGASYEFALEYDRKMREV